MATRAGSKELTAGCCDPCVWDGAHCGPVLRRASEAGRLEHGDTECEVDTVGQTPTGVCLSYFVLSGARPSLGASPPTRAHR